MFLQQNGKDIAKGYVDSIYFSSAKFDGEGALSNQSSGIKIDKEVKEQVDRIISRIRLCKRQSPKSQILINLVGYSSRVPFVSSNDVLLNNSEELNIKTANLRSQSVYKYFKEEFSPDNGVTVIQPLTWKKLSAFRRPSEDVEPSFSPASLVDQSVFLSVSGCILSPPKPDIV